MARPRVAMGTRQVVPRFWDNEELAELEHSSQLPKLRLTMIGLWAASDALGRFELRPRMLASKIYPYHEEDRAMIEPALDLFVSAGFLLKYEVDGKCYGAWPHWSEHNDFRKGTSEYPAPPGALLPRNPPKSPFESESEGKGESRRSKVEWETETLVHSDSQNNKKEPDLCDHGSMLPVCTICITRSRSENTTQLAPAPPRKVGFDPFVIAVPGFTAEEVSRVAAYHWLYVGKKTGEWFWRDTCKGDDFYVRNFVKMAEQVPYGWRPPKPKAAPHAADPNCNKCHGAGGYPVPSDNQMYKKKNGSSLFQSWQHCECLAESLMQPLTDGLICESIG
jgi:hypothetical protein